MEELFYHPLDLAIICAKFQLSTKQEMTLLDEIWHKEQAFLLEPYREDQKQLLYDVLFWKQHVHEPEVCKKEVPEVYQTMQELGLCSDFYEAFLQYQGMELFFKQIRIELSCLKKPYIRIRCRTLLHQYGYKRRSQQLTDYITLCQYFYHIKTYVKGGVECCIEKVALDDMIIFRLY